MNFTIIKLLFFFESHGNSFERLDNVLVISLFFVSDIKYLLSVLPAIINFSRLRHFKVASDKVVDVDHFRGIELDRVLNSEIKKLISKMKC